MHKWVSLSPIGYQSICTKCGAMCGYLDPEPKDLVSYALDLAHQYWAVRDGYNLDDLLTCEEVQLHRVLNA